MEIYFFGSILVLSLAGLAWQIFRLNKSLEKRPDHEQFEKFSESLSQILSEKLAADSSLHRQETFNQNSQLMQTTLSQLSEFRSEQQKNMHRLGEQISKSINDIQNSNEKKLDEMRMTVDERLQKTLETRLGQTFDLVSKRLEEVHKGLGEMQSLATGVGDLKKVLTNVKTRGMLGEFQLGAILEQILATDQFEQDVRTRKGSQNHVEFAIKLPGQNPEQKHIWLPIDSKFPIQNYEELIDAYETCDVSLIEEKQKALTRKLKLFAKDISSKYLDPPRTTDFAILFLPIEGLYAEVLKHPELFESLQRECRVTVVGPTTLSALLNSLHMGFRTLAIEKRSSEVWKVLAQVKTEFKSFGGVLEKAQDRLSKTSQELDKLVGVRTRQIERRLSSIEENAESGDIFELEQPSQADLTQ